MMQHLTLADLKIKTNRSLLRNDNFDDRYNNGNDTSHHRKMKVLMQMMMIVVTIMMKIEMII